MVCAGLLVIESAITVLLHRTLPTEHLAATYLLGILIVSAIWRLRLALVMSIASAAVFDCIRHWPTVHLLSTERPNLITHFSFLAVTLTASVLAALARAGTTEAERRRREASVIAHQQAALRRIATLVASNAQSDALYSTVIDEVARCFSASTAVLSQLQPDGEDVVLASRGEAASRDLDLCVTAPILVNRTQWGTLAVSRTASTTRVTDMQAGVRDFADLVATALTNIAARQELAASRARIVTAADTARRKLERDLHDGAQQRLAYLRLKLGMVRASLPSELVDLRDELNDLDAHLTGVTQELQEFSRGIHPAILCQGLGPAIRTLARRSATPVRTELNLSAKHPDSVEIAAYYIVAEALANSAKHSHATEVRITARETANRVRITIDDNGVGGAKPSNGTGLIGLIDRVEALGGRLDISSSVGQGTSMTATIPLEQPT
ncbi:MAG: sensor histidine kinase [Mycobacterium sp.]